jgi:hypothetical protein
LYNGKIVKSWKRISSRARRKRIRLDQTRTRSLKLNSQRKRMGNLILFEEINLQRARILTKRIYSLLKTQISKKDYDF